MARLSPADTEEGIVERENDDDEAGVRPTKDGRRRKRPGCVVVARRKRKRGRGSTVAIVPTLEPFDVYLEHK